MKQIIKNNEPQEFIDWKNSANEDWQPEYSNLRSPEKDIVKNSLMQEQGGLCCYCEVDITYQDSHIEHFIPQHLPKCDNLDYNNMLCSCQDRLDKRIPRHCGKSKDHDKGCAYHPSLLISPLDKNCETKFEYDMLGNIYPVKDSAGNDDTTASYTINCLQLQKLRRARNNAIDGILECINFENSTNSSDFINNYLQRDINGIFPEFYTTIKYLFMPLTLQKNQTMSDQMQLQKSNRVQSQKSNPKSKYTCNEYREEMILLGLQKRLSSKNLTSKEKKELLIQIDRAEKQMGID